MDVQGRILKDFIYIALYKNSGSSIAGSVQWKWEDLLTNIEVKNSPLERHESWLRIWSVAVKVLYLSYYGLVSRRSSFPRRSIREDLHKSNLLPLAFLELPFVALADPVFSHAPILQQLQSHPKKVYHSGAYPIIALAFFYPVLLFF